MCKSTTATRKSHGNAASSVEPKSKRYVLTVPMTKSFKVFKYFSCDKIGSFLLLAFGEEISNWKKFFPEIVICIIVGLIGNFLWKNWS